MTDRLALRSCHAFDIVSFPQPGILLQQNVRQYVCDVLYLTATFSTQKGIMMLSLQCMRIYPEPQ